LKSIELIESGSARRERLRELVSRVQRGLAQGAWQLLPSSTAIQPLIIGESVEALRISEKLAARGVLVPAIRPPTVPQGTARLRISLSADHTVEDVDRLIEALHESARDA
jgi:8-amino-7-oxononanoate synthase